MRRTRRTSSSPPKASCRSRRDGVTQAIFYDEVSGRAKARSSPAASFGRGHRRQSRRRLSVPDLQSYARRPDLYLRLLARCLYVLSPVRGLLRTPRHLGAAAMLLFKVIEAVLLYQQRSANDTAFDDRMMAFRRQYSPQITVSDAEGSVAN